ncbi:glutamate synthase-related protein [Halorubrum sp. BOL3-1]|uniref:glutamate synthase-related protein n=1 Tax=Halorubrum sp. BOL3-1 TaxID=2497325 RepID=UPI0019D64CDB
MGCLGTRACDSNNCPVGVATQKGNLRNRLVVDSTAESLANYSAATVKLAEVMARAWGHDALGGPERCRR